MKNLHVAVLITLLVAAGVGIAYAKIVRFGLPTTPGQVRPVWSIEAKVEFEGEGRAAVVNLDIPDRLGGFMRLEEYFVARGYGLNIETDKGDRRAEWSTRRARGRQRLYYRADIVPRTAIEHGGAAKAVPPVPDVPPYEEPLASAISDILSDVRAESANVFTFVSQLLVVLNNPAPEGNVQIIRENIERGSAAWVDRLVYVLAGARISARMVRGIVLEDGVSNGQVTSWLEVHNGDQWEGFDPLSGDKGYPEKFVRWSLGSGPLYEVANGRDAHISFAVSKYGKSLTNIARERAVVGDTWLAKTLLFNLPVSTQNVYRILLMLPIGALIVAFMRTIVGIPTVGTFMPILIAVAFRETQLVWGVILFGFITAAGVSLRFYLDRLQLLLVPRLCCVLVLVILSMLVISLVSAGLGLDRGFSVALFPIVILAMVIEHMSIVWEESGAGAALKESLGTLLVAVVGYLVMTNEYLVHAVFLFPEILFIVLAAFIVIGRYTGYRVNEIMRFRDLAEDSKRHV